MTAQIIRLDEARRIKAQHRHDDLMTLYADWLRASMALWAGMWGWRP